MMTLAVSQWTQTPLEELFDFVIGGDWGKDPEYDDNLYAEALCIRGSEFRFWKSEKGKTAVLRKVKKSSLESRKLRLGDILIEISGGGPDQPVGRTVHIDQDVISFSTKPLICTNFLRLARPTDLVNSAFLNYFLTYFYKTGEVVNYQSGSNNLRNLQFKDYIKIPVPLPPQAEQTRIVEKLDEVLAQVDTIKARLDGIPAILKRFRQSVLAAAVSGRLTDSEISNWQTLPLSLAASHIVDCPHSTPKWSEKNTGKYCVRTTAFQPFKLDMADQGFVTDEIYLDRISRLKPLPGDILYSREGTVGIACQIPPKITLCLGQRMVLIRAGDKTTSSYLEIVLNSNFILEIVKSLTIGSTVPRINMSDIRAYPIPIPPIDEQKEIVRLVEQFFAFADTIEAQVKKAQARVNNLTQSILAKAFRGELVAQDPNDEPAEKLLERIAQARKEAEALAKAAKKVAKTK